MSQCPVRIQRIRLRLQKYDIEVKYKPGKELLIADALSRAYSKEEIKSLSKEIETQVCRVVEYLPIPLERKEGFQKETSMDEEMQLLIEYIKQG